MSWFCRRVPRVPDWPARMTAPVAAAYMGISEGSFLARFGPFGVKEGANKLWAKVQLDSHVAKQFGLPQFPGAPAEEADSWADYR
ncbi:MAG: hypothetical protein EON59_10100 [Alphaproteobacteria bacterium]|nr:MAG: hypothetical protein EON59_10100 [Alphaproteobacteria bacterium]